MLTGITCLMLDMDGTLTAPRLDFEKIKAEMDVPSDMSILEYIETVENDDEKHKLFMILDEHEVHAAKNAQPNAGYPELMQFLAGNGFKTAVLTRNSRKSARITLGLLGFVPDLLISREDSPYKPKPDAILKALAMLDVSADETLMVGDFKFDIISGRKAGCFTCFLTNNRDKYDCEDADFIINTLAEMPGLLNGV